MPGPKVEGLLLAARIIPEVLLHVADQLPVGMREGRVSANMCCLPVSALVPSPSASVSATMLRYVTE